MAMPHAFLAADAVADPAIDAGAAIDWPGRRIGIVLGAVAAGSRERVVFRLAERLAALGVAVDLLIPSPSAALRHEIPAAIRLMDIGGRLLRPLPSLVRLALSPPAIAGYLRRDKPDLVMTLSIPPALTTLAAKRLAGGDANIVVRQSNVMRIEGSPRYGRIDARLRDRPIRWLYPGADAFIAVAEEVADNLRQATGVEAERIHPIANGVFLDEIEQKSKEPVDHPWLQGDGPPVIVAVGRLVPKKDYPTLFAALAGLRRQSPARLIVLGDGRERARLQSLAASLGLDGAVDMPGRVANPFAFLARAKLYVLSSTYEGMPSALIEALACGCPAVSTDCPSGPSQILAKGEFGKLTPIGDIKALTEAMAAALADPPPPDRQRARARLFSAERTIDGYLGVLAKVLAGGQA